ncbi:MAG TPA: PE-PPE domain-containing protein [Mycobacterium sp.]|nr:PE-PPE domain-containing protein [Mycobacterium sp.]
MGSDPVTLAALITPANSTAQVFASSSYYGFNWTPYGQPQVVPFFLGPQGIVRAVDSSSADPRGVVVLASGWGAGQTGTALAIMAAKHDPATSNVKLVVLDNNTNRAGGGFWTTYWMFAPLLLTSAVPTPSDTSVSVIDAAYEYNINSDAPTYPIDLLADVNSLVAYVYDYGGQATAPMPQDLLEDPPQAGDPHYHYVVAPDGTVVEQYPVSSNITYVTFQSNGLPLVRPLRMLPGGNVVADAVEPVLTLLVNWGYQDNSPIPQDPGVTRPVGLLPSVSQDRALAKQLPGAVTQGVHAAQADLSARKSVMTSPLSGRNKVSPGSLGDKASGGSPSGLGGAVSSLSGGAPKNTTKTAGSSISAKPSR